MGLGAKMQNQGPAQILIRPQNEDNLKDKDDKRFWVLTYSQGIFSVAVLFLWLPYLSEKLLGSKKSWVRKILWSKKSLGRKKSWSKKVMGTKNIGSIKFFCHIDTDTLNSYWYQYQIMILSPGIRSGIEEHFLWYNEI